MNKSTQEIVRRTRGRGTIVCGPGVLTVLGGVGIATASLDWTLSWDANVGTFSPVGGGVTPNFTPPSPYNGSTFGGMPVGVSNDTIFWGAGNSHYWLSNGNNWLQAGGGNDYIQAGVGNNTLYGGGGNDTIFGGGGNNFINLESGNDQVVLQGGNNTVIGGTGDNYIASGDAEWGGDGNDTRLFVRERSEAANDVEGRMSA